MHSDEPIRIYDAPIDEIPRLDECYFYHTMTLPGIGTVEGEWDLRSNEDAYLGHFGFDGKRVLEVGTASGAICFHIERCGGKPLAYDLSENESWDIVPYPHLTVSDYIDRKKHIRRLNNGYWLAHRAYQSSARVAYGSVYTIPMHLGEFDVATYCSILLHLRDPFLALMKGTRLAKQAVIIVEPFGRMFYARRLLASFRRLFQQIPVIGSPCMQFLPNWTLKAPDESWWTLNPEVVRAMLGVLGFQDTTLTFHDQLHKGRKIRMFTVVGLRTHEVPLLKLM
jgi:hypothetical protein